MAGTQPKGWPRKEFFDDRDKYYVPKKYFNLTELSKSGPFNLREDTQDRKYAAYFPESFYDQTPSETDLDSDCWGTCAANATAAAFVYEWNGQNLPAIDPSRLY